MLPGAYTHFTMVKKNWDTMRAVSVLAKKLGVSRNRLTYAGTKDKHAITTQRVCARKVSIEKLKAQ